MTESALERRLPDEAATLALGAALAQACRDPLRLYLHGALGAGKTTLVRGLLQALGHRSPVKSPTYTLVEPYHVSGPSGGRDIYHFDLYRLSEPEELEYMGGRDYFDAGALCLVEWPERGGRWLPGPDLDVYLEYSHPDSTAADEMPAERAGVGRLARLVARTAAGRAVLAALREAAWENGG